MIGIVGFGTMGAAIVQVVLRAGYPVTVNEVSQDLLDKDMKRLVAGLKRLAEKGTITRQEGDTSLSENDRLVRFADNLRNHIRAFYFRLRDMSGPHVGFAHKEHRKIVEAIQQRKPVKVEQLIRARYLHSKVIFTKHMNKSL